MKNDKGTSAYVVFNKGVTPATVSFYKTIENIPKDIRHYAQSKEDAKFLGPDAVRIISNFEIGRFKEALDFFYPGHPNCTLPEYADRLCIAESCRYAPNENWYECPYYPKYETGEV